MYQLGATLETMMDVEIYIEGNVTSMYRPRRVSCNLNGVTLQQVGVKPRDWRGKILASSADEMIALENLYIGQRLYFSDGTSIGTDSPIEVIWSGEYTVDFEDPRLSSGSVTFTFLEA